MLTDDLRPCRSKSRPRVAQIPSRLRKALGAGRAAPAAAARNAAAAGYGLLGGAAPATIAVVQAFAAGAILTMLADTMMPESFENAGNTVGLVTCAGFISAFLLSHVP